MSFMVKLPDGRNEISECGSGAYYVQKKRIVARFGFGVHETFNCAAEAHVALVSFLAGRKDADTLFVNLLEFQKASR